MRLRAWLKKGFQRRAQLMAKAVPCWRQASTMASASAKVRAMGFSAHTALTPARAQSWTICERIRAVVQTLTKIEVFSLQHLAVVAVEMVLLQTPTLAENGALFVVQIGSGDQFRMGRSAIRGGVAIGQKNGSSFAHFIVEGAAHAAQADNGGAISSHDLLGAF